MSGQAIGGIVKSVFSILWCFFMILAIKIAVQRGPWKVPKWCFCRKTEATDKTCCKFEEKCRNCQTLRIFSRYFCRQVTYIHFLYSLATLQLSALLSNTSPLVDSDSGEVRRDIWFHHWNQTNNLPAQLLKILLHNATMQQHQSAIFQHHQTAGCVEHIQKKNNNNNSKNPFQKNLGNLKTLQRLQLLWRLW